MALSFDLSPAKYLMLGSFERHAFDAAFRYAGAPLQAHARFGSFGPLRWRICSLVASVVMLLRAHERFGSLGPARWKHPNRSRKTAASCLPVYFSASLSSKATRKNGCRKRTPVPEDGTPLNRLTTTVTRAAPRSYQARRSVTHSEGGPPRAQERFGSAGPARRQHPNRGTQQSG